MPTTLRSLRSLGRSFAAKLYDIAAPSARDVQLRPLEAKNVLLVRTDEIGDMIMFTPVLREFRRNLPDARVTLLAREDVANLVERCPYVDEIIRAPKIIARGSFRQAVPALVSFSRSRLKPRKFDLAIMTRWDQDFHRSALTTLVSGATARVGYGDNMAELRDRIGPIADRVFTHTFSDQPNRHGVEKNLRLLELLGMNVADRRPELWWDDTDSAVVEEVFAAAGDGPVLALGIGSNEDKRCWPIENYLEVLRDYDGHIFIAGGPQDREAATRIESAFPGRVLNANCALTIRQSVAAMHRCNLFLGNDSSPAHMASTAKIPILEISCHPQGGDPTHYNAPERFAAYGDQVTVLRPAPERPCTDACCMDVAHCIKNVGVEEVRRAMDRAQRKSPGA